jgi:hypothetical protein
VKHQVHKLQQAIRNLAKMSDEGSHTKAYISNADKILGKDAI